MRSLWSQDVKYWPWLSIGTIVLLLVITAMSVITLINTIQTVSDREEAARIRERRALQVENRIETLTTSLEDFIEDSVEAREGFESTLRADSSRDPNPHL